MSRLNEHVIVLAALAAASTGASAQPAPQTTPPAAVSIGDMSNAQRAAIEAEIRRTLAKAQSAMNDVTVPAPTGAVPIPLAAASAASAPGAFALPQARLAVSGVAQLRGQWYADVSTDQGSRLVPAGELVPGAAWRVGEIDDGHVVLVKVDARPVKGKKPQTRSFHFASRQ
jgi:hypothetical protein